MAEGDFISRLRLILGHAGTGVVVCAAVGLILQGIFEKPAEFCSGRFRGSAGTAADQFDSPSLGFPKATEHATLSS